MKIMKNKIYWKINWGGKNECRKKINTLYFHCWKLCGGLENSCKLNEKVLIIYVYIIEELGGNFVILLRITINEIESI